VQRRCNIITARAYKDIPQETAGILANEPPLHLTITECAVKWMLIHNMKLTEWGHLTAVEWTG